MCALYRVCAHLTPGYHRDYLSSMCSYGGVSQPMTFHEKDEPVLEESFPSTVNIHSFGHESASMRFLNELKRAEQSGIWTVPDDDIED